MASWSVRDLDDGVREKLRVRAAAHGRSMEAEVRAILSDAVDQESRSPMPWLLRLHEAGHAVGGVDLEVPRPEPPRDPPTFD